MIATDGRATIASPVRRAPRPITAPRQPRLVLAPAGHGACCDCTEYALGEHCEAHIEAVYGAEPVDCPEAHPFAPLPCGCATCRFPAPSVPSWDQRFARPDGFPLR